MKSFLLKGCLNIRWVILILMFKVLLAEVPKESVMNRLNSNLRPFEYHIYLAYHLRTGGEAPFCGLVHIEFSTSKATNKIELHAKQLNITKQNIILRHEDLYMYSIIDLNFNTERDTIAIKTGQNLEVGRKHILTIAFSGIIRSDLAGSYFSNYRNAQDGTAESLVVTQFEAIAARKAFPCFDEPAMKANFSIYLAHDRKFTALSNMPCSHTSSVEFMSPYWTWTNMADLFSLDKEVLEKQWIWDVFAKTKPMSTYLVAWVISNFGKVEVPQGASRTQMSVWAHKDALPQLNYASHVARKILDHYERWFDIPFALPKIDMVAIPDFAPGAMENWGLITYRETTLMYDQDQSSHDSQEKVCEVIAHELGHQWFGNLVTMEWWSDLWLNEGFATYMAMIGTDAAEPSWNLNDVSVSNKMLSVLQADSLASSRPISVPVGDPNLIGQIFDGITYSKAAMVIRMMHLFLGDRNFRQGLNAYLKRNSYANADKQKLWLALAASNNVKLPAFSSFSNIMDSWTLQTGYPLLTVIRDYKRKTVEVTQKRFLTLETLTENSKGKWFVPLSSLSEGEEISKTRSIVWLQQNEGVEIPLKLGHDASNTQWIVLNVGMLAPIRVNYDQKNWDLLKMALNDPNRYDKIPVLSRAQILDDAFALADVSKLKYNTTLSLALYLQNETDLVPMRTGLNCLSRFDRNLGRTEHYGALADYVKKIITPTYNRLGGLKYVRSKNMRDIKMQILAAAWACRIGVPDCEDTAASLITQWKSHPEQNPVPQDLRSVVYCAGIKRGGPDEWEFLNKQKMDSIYVSEKSYIMDALACSREVWILQRYLEWTLTDEHGIRSQDAGTVIMAVMREPLGLKVAQDFIFKMIKQISDRLVSQDSMFGNVLKRLLQQYTIQEQLDEFLRWRKLHGNLLKRIKLAIDQGIEGARINIRWTRKHQDNVIAVLEQLAK